MADGARLADQVALVTGSTGGLGAELAVAFAAEGADVVVTGRDAERGSQVAARCRDAGSGSAAFIPADLADEGSTTAMVGAAASRFGRLTVVVNNAVASDAVAHDARCADLTTSAWDAALLVNATAAFWVCRAAIHRLAEAGGGAILNISSRVASHATPGLAAYAASKGALEALTRSIATDHAADGIRCNAIAPGYVRHARRDADLDADTPEATARRTRLEAMHLTRLVEPADVAAAAVWLCSPEAEAVTGLVLPLDGGSTNVARATAFG